MSVKPGMVLSDGERFLKRFPELLSLPIVSDPMIMVVTQLVRRFVKMHGFEVPLTITSRDGGIRP